MSSHTKALLAIFVAALLWASAGAVAKLLVAQVHPFVATFYRFGIASLVMIPFFIQTRKPKHFLRDLLPLGLFNAGNVLFYYSGLALTTANTAAILGAAVPIITALLSSFLIREPVSKQKYWGITLGLVGALCIVFLPMWAKGQAFSGNLLGNVLLVGSTLSWTFYIIYSRALLSKGTYTPFLSTSINLFTCTATAALASIVTGQTFPLSVLASPSYLGTLLYASFGLTIITFFLFQWAVQHVSASTASLKEYLQLVIGIGVNYLVLGERFTTPYMVGSVLVLIGVFVATGEHLSKRLATSLFSQGE